MAARKKVLVAMNTLTSINMGPYTDHARFYYRLGRDYLKFDFFQFFARRMSIDRFRNAAAKLCVDGKFDYLLFIDDDMFLPADTFGKLYEAKLDICMAHVYIRGYPFEIMAFKDAPSDNPKHKRLINLTQEDIASDKVRKDGVIRCDAIGTAVSLINCKIFKKVPAPWFVTGPNNTEDIYFCMKSKDYIKNLTIGMHTKVITGHQLDPEVISVDTRDALRTYHQSYMSEEQKLAEQENKSGDRGLAYVMENIEPKEGEDATN